MTIKVKKTSNPDKYRETYGDTVANLIFKDSQPSEETEEPEKEEEAEK